MKDKNKIGLSGAHPKLGILGAGQLGKMLAHAASKLDLPLSFMDKSKAYPAGPYAAAFMEGDFKNYDDVMAFGQTVDVLTIEIEHVNIEALFDLEKQGKIIHPNPRALDIIKDKGLQKAFYKSRKIPTSDFEFYEGKNNILEAIKANSLAVPFVQKARTAGYDGKGVELIRGKADLAKIMDCPSIVEPLVPIDKEIAVIAARNESGEVSCFDVVEMEFEPKANLVEFLYCPSSTGKTINAAAERIAKELIEAYEICGLLAVEFFLTKNGELLVNEVAPRPHNSGHHSIDACITSQFEQHLRGVLNLPLGATDILMPSVMINLLGDADYSGPVKYIGENEVKNLPGVNLHLYGKKETRPMRKMGHATVVDSDLKEAKLIAKKIKSIFKIQS